MTRRKEMLQHESSYFLKKRSESPFRGHLETHNASPSTQSKQIFIKLFSSQGTLHHILYSPFRKHTIQLLQIQSFISTFLLEDCYS